MKFSYARPCKWCIVYTIDSDSDKKEYHRLFNTHPALWSWMEQNEDKTILRMSIEYNY